MPHPPRRRFTRFLLLALLFCFSAGIDPLIAADDKNKNDSEKKSDDEVRIDERVVVTATRTEMPLRRVASTVTVITAEEIRRRQHRFVTDVLRDIPGVDVRQDGGPGTSASIFIRGADSDHTLVLLDGVELNDPAAPSRLAILNSLTTDGIERIEVLRGPQSTLYGADAIGGVIQIFTHRGAGAPTTIVSGEGGSNPAWSRDGRQIYHKEGIFPVQVMMVVDVAPGDPFGVGRARSLIDPWRYTGARPVRAYDVLADGSFIVNLRGVDEAAGNEESPSTFPPERMQFRISELHIVLNFFEELRQRMGN